MEFLTSYTGLSGPDILTVSAICFAAGVVRGFTGFALSALIMAAAALIIAPVELIPMMWWLEITASLLMVRGGWADADRRIALILIIGSAIGTPFGLWLTLSVSPDVSRLLALAIIIALAVMQLAKIRIPALATTTGTGVSGILAGIATGLAGVGGMVVALYVLAQELPARVMRATLVLFLFGSSLASFAIHTTMGTMTWEALYRGLTFALPVALGVIAGKLLFTPRFETYYKPACLFLLIGLAVSGIFRLMLG